MLLRFYGACDSSRYLFKVQILTQHVWAETRAAFVTSSEVLKSEALTERKPFCAETGHMC